MGSGRIEIDRYMLASDGKLRHTVKDNTLEKYKEACNIL